MKVTTKKEQHYTSLKLGGAYACVWASVLPFY